MKIFTKLFRRCDKNETTTELRPDEVDSQKFIQGETVPVNSVDMSQLLEAQTTFLRSLQKILEKNFTDSSTEKYIEADDNSMASVERHENESPAIKPETSHSKRPVESDNFSTANPMSSQAVEAICHKMLSWDEQRDVISSMSPNDVISFIIRDCKQVLYDLDITTISDDKKFNISRHEPVELNGKIPHPDAEIDSIVEEGFELDGKVLIRAKVKLK